jgi:hypothetical protein
MIHVVAADLGHCDALVAGMGASERAEMIRLGAPPAVWIKALIDGSGYGRTALVNGMPIAAWGIVGTALSFSGEAWLVATEAARRRRYDMVRLGVAEIRAMLRLKTEIVSSVLCGDTRGRRFSAWLGFGDFEDVRMPDGEPLHRGMLRRA